MRLVHALALGSAVLLASCATSPPMIPVTDPHTPVAGMGFEVLPPQGSDWYLTHRTDKGVMYGKTLEKRPSNRTLMATVHDIAAPSPLPVSRDEFARYVHDRMVRGETQGRFTLIKASASPGGAPGTFCADFANVIEERDNPNFPAIVLETFNKGFECIDRSSGFVVRGMFSERRPKGSPPVIDNVLQAELDAFLASVRMNPLRERVATSAATTGSEIAPDDGAAALPVVISISKGLSQSSPSLTDAVRAAANRRDCLRQATYDGDAARKAEYLTILLRFESTVDRSRQLSNRDGAFIGGLPTILLGAMVPWKCGVAHTLNATVLSADGREVFHDSTSEAETTVGAMTWCPDVTEPGQPLATKMADHLFAKIEQTRVLTARGAAK